MMDQLTFWPEPLTPVPGGLAPGEEGQTLNEEGLALDKEGQTPVETSEQPWPLGVWLRVQPAAEFGSEATVVGRVNGYSYDALGEKTVLLINDTHATIVSIHRVIGVVSPNDGQPRTGFPKVCPTGHAEPVLAVNCEGCRHRQRLPRGVWRCTHRAYQAAPGVHFCLDCGIELGPYAEARGWAYCGKEKCLKGQALHLRAPEMN